MDDFKKDNLWPRALDVAAIYDPVVKTFGINLKHIKRPFDSSLLKNALQTVTRYSKLLDGVVSFDFWKMLLQPGSYMGLASGCYSGWCPILRPTPFSCVGDIQLFPVFLF